MRLSIKDNDVWVSLDDEQGVPDLKLKGRWDLDRSSQLLFRLDAANPEGLPRTLKFQTDWLSADKDVLAVSVSHAASRTALTTYLFHLKGSWSLDRYNRLRFNVKRTNGVSDRLRFDGHWDLNADTHISYVWQDLEKQTKHQFILKGQWRIQDGRYLSYHFQGGHNEPLMLRADLQTKSIRSKKDTLRYRWGIGFYRSQRDYRKLTLHGLWKVSHDLDAQFEVTDADRHWNYSFEVKKAILSSSKVSVELRMYDRDPQLIRLRLDHSFWDSARAFAVWQKQFQQKWSLEVGMSLSF